MHLQPFLLGLVWDRAMTCDTLIYWRFALNASTAARAIALFFLFFFCCYCRSHNESGPNPLPPIWKFFRLSAMCELLKWPLRIFETLHFAHNLRQTGRNYFSVGRLCRKDLGFSFNWYSKHISQFQTYRKFVKLQKFSCDFLNFLFKNSGISCIHTDSWVCGNCHSNFN